MKSLDINFFKSRVRLYLFSQGIHTWTYCFSLSQQRLSGSYMVNNFRLLAALFSFASLNWKNCTYFLTPSWFYLSIYLSGFVSPCPEPYVSLDVPKELNDPGNVIKRFSSVASVQSCAAHCDSESICCSFEYSRNNQMCNLGDECKPTSRLGRDQVFCGKQILPDFCSLVVLLSWSKPEDPAMLCFSWLQTGRLDKLEQILLLRWKILEQVKKMEGQKNKLLNRWKSGRKTKNLDQVEERTGGQEIKALNRIFFGHSIISVMKKKCGENRLIR